VCSVIRLWPRRTHPPRQIRTLTPSECTVDVELVGGSRMSIRRSPTHLAESRGSAKGDRSGGAVWRGAGRTGLRHDGRMAWEDLYPPDNTWKCNDCVALVLDGPAHIGWHEKHGERARLSKL